MTSLRGRNNGKYHHRRNYGWPEPAGIIYSSDKSASKVDAKLDKQQAIIETKMDELTREVREHNNFARRMPVVEEQIKVINHRSEDLENFHKPA